MDIRETLEADWIQIRAILKAQVKRLETGETTDAGKAEATARAHHWITECEKIILSYSVKV